MKQLGVSSSGTAVARLVGGDVVRMVELNDLFGHVFGEPQTYCRQRPSPIYLERLLSNQQIVPLVALDGDRIVGGLVAYELVKFEQARSEIYIYDLAVLASHRRQGVATALINALKPIARACGAHVIFVQAEPGDEPPITLYSNLGRREDVLHFDISVEDN